MVKSLKEMRIADCCSLSGTPIAYNTYPFYSDDKLEPHAEPVAIMIPRSAA